MRRFVLVLTLLACASAAHAEVKRIVIDRKVSPAFDGKSFGSAGQYETLAGRAFGELDPNDPHNRVITDIRLAQRNANGKVEYVATFFLVKPIDMSKASHLMWHDVPNRGGRITIAEAERMLGDIGLSSGWQGDNSGATAPGPNNDYVVVPIAKNRGRVPDHRPRHRPDRQRDRPRLAADARAQQQSGAVQAGHARHDEGDADDAHRARRSTARSAGRGRSPSSDWAWARCSADEPVPGHARSDADLREGRLRSEAAVPGCLHRAGSLRARHRLRGVPRRRVLLPQRGERQRGHRQSGGAARSRGSSAAAGRSPGNFLRAFLHLGFNQDEAGPAGVRRRVADHRAAGRCR